MVSPQQKAYIQLHVSVLLFGLTAILGALITLPALILVWWRLLLSCLGLLFIVNPRQALAQMPRSYRWQFVVIGILVALHWISFFAAIKLANASVALVCLATAPLFTAILEPYVMQKKHSPMELIFGLLLVPGMALVVNGVSADYLVGIAVGLISALLVSIFLVMGKRIVDTADAATISFVELSSALIFLTLLLPLYFYFSDAGMAFMPIGVDWLYLAILSFFCTSFAYYIAQQALKKLSAFSINLTTNLEPIYGILLAYWVLQEHRDLGLSFYYGVTIILSSVLLFPLIASLRQGRYKKQLR